jgi:ABC-type polysaccharide transport system permease subunit
VSDLSEQVGEDKAGTRFWAGLALPGIAWLAVFFVLPFYVILCIAFGSVHPIFQTAAPEWNEDEKFILGAEIGCITDTGGSQVGLRAPRQ